MHEAHVVVKHAPGICASLGTHSCQLVHRVCWVQEEGDEVGGLWGR